MGVLLCTAFLSCGLALHTSMPDSSEAQNRDPTR
jgi:hypothetical protein